MSILAWVGAIIADDVAGRLLVGGAVESEDSDWYRTVGMLVAEWARLEERCPSEAGGVDAEAVAEASGATVQQLHRARRFRNAAAHSSRSSGPSLDQLDEALGILHWVWERLDGDVRKRTVHATAELGQMSPSGVAPPTTYPNPRNDNPWDSDAVWWLLDKPDVAASFQRIPLFECLRMQRQRVSKQPHRVEEAARFAQKYGVIQRLELDERMGKRVVRLYRTDPDRPRYPGSPPPAAR